MEGVQIAVCVLLLSVAALAQDRKNELLRIPPSITKVSPRYRLYAPGEIVELVCEASGIPEPEFTWFQHGAEFEKNTPGIEWNKGTMKIKSTTANFAGEWQCFASNMHGKSMSHIIVMEMATITGYAPPIETREYRVDPGQKLKLICKNLKSVPDATFTWAKVEGMEDPSEGQAVQTTKRMQIDPEGHLYFSNVQPSDDKEGQLYKCNVYNGYVTTTKGGSFSRITVNPGSPTPHAPVIEYNTPSPTTGLRGKSVSLKCVFSGNSSPSVQWIRRKSSLPFRRHTITDQGTTLTLIELEDDDKGDYVCKGSNNVGDSEAVIQVVIDSEPKFTHSYDKPMNENFTEGGSAEFHCDADARPVADIIWYINGDEISSEKPGPRRSITDNGRRLVVTDLCKDCVGEGNHKSDLMNIQCMASNIHNYSFADAYLNVLRATRITTPPVDVTLVHGEEMKFACDAETDDSTTDLLQYTWEYNDDDLVLEEGRVEVLDDHTLLLITENDDDKGESMGGKYTCIATNSYSTDQASAKVIVEAVGPVAPVTKIGDVWYIFVIIAIILLILILLFCCCLCMQRNKGDTYPVDEKERANGNDPVKELEEMGYHDYQRPEEAPMKGSRASLTSTLKYNSDDEGSLNEYGGDIDTGKFNEDGSFIGQYIEKDKKRPKEAVV